MNAPEDPAARLTHLDDQGRAHMVDVAEKSVTHRIAVATGRIRMKPETLDLIRQGAAAKGDVIATARIAGIMAAKKTHDLIPLCHPIPLTKVAVEFEIDEALPGLIVTTTAKALGQTGVEMEALSAVSVSLLTIYDMAKAVDRGMEITGIGLLKKSGGKSGDWTSEKPDT